MNRRGLNSQEASEVAEMASGIAAIPYTLLDKLAVGLIRGKAPFLTRTLESMANRFKSAPGRFAARTFGAGVFELATEDGQDALVPITEELAAALSKDSRLAIGAWRNGHDGYLDGFWTRQVVIFGSMAPFAGMAGLGGIDQDARANAYAQASDAQLMALGHGPQAVAAIREAQGKGIFSAHLAIGEAQKTRDPFSTEAKAAVDQLVAEAEQQRAAVEQAQLSGAMPTFHHSADGTTWTVYDGASSAEIGKAANANDALRLAAAHSSAVDESNADLLAYLGSTMMGIGKLADGKTETLFRPGMELTAEQQAAVSEGDFESIRAQVAARDLLAGTPGMAGVVLGRSVTEFKQGVRRTVNELNAGAALPTVFHETTHGHLEEAWAGGALSRGETENFLRAADTIFAGKTTKDGRPIRFLPDGPVSDTMLREGVSEFAEMELFRTRSGGKAGAGKPAIAGLPSGLISRNVAAFARLAPGAAEKFTRFLEAARSFWGVILKRATVMDKAVREGRMSEAELDAFKEKLYGLKGPDAAIRREAVGRGDEGRGISEMPQAGVGSPAFSLASGGPEPRKTNKAPEPKQRVSTEAREESKEDAPAPEGGLGDSIDVASEGNATAADQQTANEENENGGEDRVEDMPDGGKVITTPGGVPVLPR
ncbi:hypothetical protein [Luteolibacter sp. Populi]|uniref:hypothetical protein n=1 Tax=Luteolibacter sp. Populi TaxID=3230487 RepID=UPI00346743DC